MEIFLQLILAAVLGGLVGLEREYQKKAAGLRTYSLVSLGSALFTIIAFQSFLLFPESSSFDPGRIAGQIVVGVGFIGAGLIINRRSRVAGLTTAAGLWVAAAIGVATGMKLYAIAIFVAAVAIVILFGLKVLEEKLFGKRDEDPKE